MNSLPNETLREVVEYVYFETSEGCFGDKSALLNLRRTCKTLEALCTRYAFRTLTLKHQIPSYEKIITFSQSDLGHQLQHLIYNFEEKPDTDTTDATRELMECARLEKHGLDVASLTSIFCRLKNLEKVTVVQTRGLFGSNPRVCSNFFTALYTSNTRLSSLDLQSCVDLGPASHVFDGYKDVFQQLRSLSLPLRSNDGYAINEKLFFTLTQSLEELTCWSPYRDPAFPLDSYIRFHIPHLRAISLRTLAINTAALLIQFFTRHSSSLKRVELCDLQLARGTWESVFLEMRRALRLKSCILDGDFFQKSMRVFETDIEKQRRGWKLVPHHAVEDFVKGLTDENPFNVLQANVHQANALRANLLQDEGSPVACATQ